jgi:hypothetical protein
VFEVRVRLPKIENGNALEKGIQKTPKQTMSTPMKIPRTMKEQYEIVRGEDEEQRKRKTSVKRETVSPTACRRIMLTPDAAIHTITIPCEDTSVRHTPTLPGSDSTPHTPLPGSNTTPSATTPHARSFESQPNDPW